MGARRGAAECEIKMAEDNGVEFPIGIDLTDYNRDINTLVSGAGDADDALNKIISTAGKAEAALNAIDSNIGVDVTIDSSEVDTVTNTLAGLDDLTPDVTVSVTDDEIVSAISDLEKLSEGQTATAQVEDNEITSAITDLEKLSEDQSSTVNVDASEVDDVKRLLEQIRTLSVINLALEIPASVTEFIQNIPLLNSLADRDTAGRIVAASVPEGVTNAEDIISDLYVNSTLTREEIARLVSTLANIGIDDKRIKGVAQELIDAQLAIEGITGEAPGMDDLISRTQDLISLGFADNYSDASDILIAGFQSSAAVGGDFLGDLGEFAPTFATLGFTAEQMLTTLSTGLAGGVDNISRMSEGLISFNELASQSDENFIATLGTLDQVAGTDLTEQLDLFQAGELTGADFMAGVLEAARTYADTNGVTAAQGILGSLFGGTASNIGAEALLSIDPNADEFTDLENRAAEASTNIKDSLTGAVTEFQRLIEETALNFLSSDQLDLDGKIEAIKTGLSDAVAVLQSGGTLGEALEVGFKIQGVDEFILNFQSVVGNFVINLLEMIASVQEFLGKDATGTRATIAGLAEQQFAFDIQDADAAEISELIRQAIERGVDPATLGTTIQTGITTALEAGDVARAQALLTGAQGATQTVRATDSLGAFGGVAAALNPTLGAGVEQSVALPNIDTAAATEQIQMAATDLREEFYAALATDPTKAVEIAQQLQDPILTAMAAAAQEVAAAEAATRSGLAVSRAEDDDFSAEQGADVLASVTELDTATSEAADAVTQNAANMEDAIRSVGTTTTEVISGNTMTEDFEVLHTAADDHLVPVIDYINTLKVAAIEAGGAFSVLGGAGSTAFGGLNAGAAGAGNPFDAAPKFAEGGIAGPGIFSAGEQGQEFISTDTSVAVLNNATTRDIYAAVASVLGGANPNVNNSNNRVQNIQQINYIQSPAQQDASTQKLANAVRGY